MWIAVILFISVIVICICAKIPTEKANQKEKPSQSTELSDEDILLMWMIDEDDK